MTSNQQKTPFISRPLMPIPVRGTLPRRNQPRVRMVNRLYRWCWLAGVLVMSVLTPVKANETLPDHHLLILTSLGGESYYTELFNRWATTMIEVATSQLGLKPQNAHWLGETSDTPEASAMTGESRRETILQTLETLATRSKPDDVVLILMIGHGSYSGNRALFNIPGPDISADDLSDALEPMLDRQVAIVNTTPSSAPFIEALSAPGRIIVTATANSRENHHTRIAGDFVSAWIDDAADRDKDNRVSLLEAFQFSKQQTARFYEDEGRLLTEHAQLDDNGDSVGSREPNASPDPTTREDGPAVDGALAHRFFFDPRTFQPTGDEDPETTRLRLALTIDARDLVDQVERLKRQKNVMPYSEYSELLEVLLVELALNRREYRNLGNSPEATLTQ